MFTYILRGGNSKLLFRNQLDHTGNQHEGKQLPSVHVLGDFNSRDIDWPDRLNKSGSALSQSGGQMLIDNMIMVWSKWCTSPLEKKYIRFITSLPGQFQDIHSPDKLSDHNIVAGTLKVVIPPPPL